MFVQRLELFRHRSTQLDYRAAIGELVADEDDGAAGFGDVTHLRDTFLES